MGFSAYDSRRFFLLAIRPFFGTWLLSVGLVKWLLLDPENFVGHISADFDATWSPHPPYGFLPWLIMTALLMFLLTLGQTILLKPEVIANCQYLVLTLACAPLSDPESKPPPEQGP